MVKDDNNNIQNLVLNEKPDGTFETLLAIYQMTEEEYKNIDYYSLIQKEVKFYPIEFDQNGLMQFKFANPYAHTTCDIQWTWTEVENDKGDLRDDMPGTHFIWQASFLCTFSGGGGGGDGGGDASTGQTGSNGNNNPNNNENPQGSSGSGGGGVSSGNPNTTGGVYGNGGLDGTGITTTPVVPTAFTSKKIKQDFQAFLLINNPNELNWFNQQGNSILANEIVNYLFENQRELIEGQTHNQFALQIIQQIILNPNTFISINPFLIEDQIDDSQLNPCEKSVFENIKNTTNNDFAKVFAKLGANGEKYKTNIVSAVAPTGSIGQTVRLSAYNYQVYISTDYAGKTKLMIAAALLHELTHAYFLSLIDDCFVANNNCNLLQTYPDLWAYYVANKTTIYPSNSLSHHEQIANSFITAISEALKEYQPGLQQQVYEDLAWAGLEDTFVFNTKFPINSLARQRILNRKAAESSGFSIGDGTPAYQAPLGINCN
jgi:hypothetical protein